MNPTVAADAPDAKPSPDHVGWLRAAVLGADDGIISTAAIMLGVAASKGDERSVLVAAFAGIVAGATSMAAGEYVSVSSQRDLEESLRRHEQQLAETLPNVALTELAVALQLRGIDPGLARRVAAQISAAEPVDAGVRVKYGLTETTAARPLQAALASAVSFVLGGAIPLLAMLAPTPRHQALLTVGLALGALLVCGTLAAGVGGAPRVRGALRVALGGGLAMALSALLGRLVGAAL
jgi:vacuolar iron transporter family protein